MSEEIAVLIGISSAFILAGIFIGAFEAITNRQLGDLLICISFTIVAVAIFVLGLLFTALGLSAPYNGVVAMAIVIIIAETEPWRILRSRRW